MTGEEEDDESFDGAGLIAWGAGGAVAPTGFPFGSKDLFFDRGCGCVRSCGGRSSGLVIPICAISFCCFVGRGFRVDMDTSMTGGGSGAMGDQR